MRMQAEMETKDTKLREAIREGQTLREQLETALFRLEVCGAPPPPRAR